MPCKQCKDGKYKWGNTGECKYSTKEACEKSNPKKYNKMQPTPLGKKTYEEYAKELKEFNLSTEPKLTKVELSVADDVLSDVSANGKSRSKYRQIIRQVRKDLAKAYEHLENIKKRDERIQKNSKAFKKQADELGVGKELKPPYNYIYDGLYIDKQLENDMTANEQAVRAVLKSSESVG
tara:strand:- start:176 stop:712 length:537 start_codon:yes stop_codon:yes gene_type:complete